MKTVTKIQYVVEIGARGYGRGILETRAGCSGNPKYYRGLGFRVQGDISAYRLRASFDANCYDELMWVHSSVQQPMRTTINCTARPQARPLQLRRIFRLNIQKRTTVQFLHESSRASRGSNRRGSKRRTQGAQGCGSWTTVMDYCDCGSWTTVSPSYTSPF